jgi:hypothetical protein
MAHDPHTTTLATATDTSACVAAIAGASADTAVTPHMDVPAANSEPSLGCNPAVFAIFGMRNSPCADGDQDWDEGERAGFEKVRCAQLGADAHDADAQHGPARGPQPRADPSWERHRVVYSSPEQDC